MQNSTKKFLLNEIIVKANKPLVMNGDTIEYTIKSKLPVGMSSKNFFKRLYGFNVDKDNNVSVNGVSVERILIDKMPVFETNTAILLENFPADAIERIQVYEDKTNITGLKNGISRRIINIQLRPEFKKSVFGSGEIISGLNFYKLPIYQVKALTNKIDSMNHFAVLGLVNNYFSVSTSNPISSIFIQNLYNATDLGFQPNQPDDEILPLITHTINNSFGIPKNSLLNGSYNTNRKKQKFSFNILTNWHHNKGKIHFKNIILLPENEITIKDTSNTEQEKNTFLMFGKYENEINPKTKWSLQFNTIHTNNYLQSKIFQENFVREIKKTNTYRFIQVVDNQLLWLNSTGTLTHHFNKKGKHLSLNFGFYRNTETEQINQKYDSVARSQNQQFENLKLSYKNSFAYSQPLSKNIIWLNYYSLIFKNNHVVINTNNFISDFSNSNIINQIGTGLRYNPFFGTVFFGLVRQNVITKNDKNQYEEANIIPNFSFETGFGKAKLNIGYFTKISTPIITQLQPIANIKNPTQQQIGNENLILGTTPELNISLNFFNPQNLLSTNVNFSRQTSRNQVVWKQFLDEKGVLFSTAVNISGAKSNKLNIYFGFPLLQNKGSIALRSILEHNTGIVPFYSQTNFYTEKAITLNIKTNYKINDYSNIILEQTYSVKRFFTNLPNPEEYAKNFNSMINIDFKLLQRFYFSSVCNYSQSNYNKFHVSILNVDFEAYTAISRVRNFQLKILLKNLLNQNLGQSIGLYPNSVIWQKATTMPRYFAVELSYNFRKFKKNVP